MTGSGVIKRNNVLAIRAAKLAEQGWTHRNIAEALEKQPEQIPELILRGEWLMQGRENDME